MPRSRACWRATEGEHSSVYHRRTASWRWSSAKAVLMIACTCPTASLRLARLVPQRVDELDWLPRFVSLREPLRIRLSGERRGHRRSGGRGSVPESVLQVKVPGAGLATLMI